ARRRVRPSDGPHDPEAAAVRDRRRGGRRRGGGPRPRARGQTAGPSARSERRPRGARGRPPRAAAGLEARPPRTRPFEGAPVAGAGGPPRLAAPGGRAQRAAVRRVPRRPQAAPASRRMKLPMLSADDKLAEIRRLYFQTTKQTIQSDLTKALDLLKSMPSE